MFQVLPENISHLLTQGTGYFWHPPSFNPQQPVTTKGYLFAKYPRLVSHLGQSPCLYLHILCWQACANKPGLTTEFYWWCLQDCSPALSFLFTPVAAILVPAFMTSELATEQNTVIFLPSSLGMDRVVQLFQGQEVGVEEGTWPKQEYNSLPVLVLGPEIQWIPDFTLESAKVDWGEHTYI